MTLKTIEQINLSQQGRVLTITINNPPENFLNTDIMLALNQLMTDLAKRIDIGAVIITGAIQDVFLTHFDVNDIERAVESIPMVLSVGMVKTLTRIESVMNSMPYSRQLLRNTPMAGVSDMNIFHEVTTKMRAMDKVFIAAINGRAMGAGCELALACDLRIMADGKLEDGIMIGQPEALLGLIPGGGGTQMLTRGLGIFKALEHCLEARPISAADALTLGIVNRVVPPDQLLSAALSWAEPLARRSPFSIRGIKNSIYQGAAQNFDTGMALEKNTFLAAASQPNTRIAMEYYIAKIRDLMASDEVLQIQDFQPLMDGVAVDMTTKN